MFPDVAHEGRVPFDVTGAGCDGADGVLHAESRPKPESRTAGPNQVRFIMFVLAMRWRSAPYDFVTSGCNEKLFGFSRLARVVWQRTFSHKEG
jgi:hypothetical protein